MSTSFKNGDVLFSWSNLHKKYYDVKINNQWIRIKETNYIVIDALLYDYIGIIIRVEASLKYYKLTYYGELCMVFASLYFTLLFHAFKFE